MMRGTYFGASNSGAGFVSYFGELVRVREFERVCLIKGGPGTGKSSLMRRVAEAAEARGLAVRRYLCSSDPDSLDGIAVEGKFALLDATAPHAQDCVLPGAVDELVDLGQFWDASALAGQRDEIAALGEKKKAAYARAYRWLGGVESVMRCERAMLAACVDGEKLRRAAGRLVRELSAEAESAVTSAVTSAVIESVGMRGHVVLPTMAEEAERVFVLRDARGGGTLFLEALLDACRARGVSVGAGWRAVAPDMLCGIIVPSDGVAFLDGEVAKVERAQRDVRVINMARFWLPERLRSMRGELRLAVKCRAGLMEGADEAFCEVREAHFALESIYAAAMDFAAVEAFGERLIARLLG